MVRMHVLVIASLLGAFSIVPAAKAGFVRSVIHESLLAPIVSHTVELTSDMTADRDAPIVEIRLNMANEVDGAVDTMLPIAARKARKLSETYSIDVDSEDEEWVTTDIQVDEGDEVEIRAKGKVKTTPNGVDSGPEGQPYICDVDACVVMRKPYGALIMRVGAAKPVAVGRTLTYRPTHAGRIEFVINDQGNHYDDNNGTYAIMITVTHNPAEN